MPTDKKRSKIAGNEVASSFDGAHRNVIYERLMNAISEHRLQPGTKLTEDRLSTIFSVSRTTVRAVLQQLAHELVVTIVPNRGAFVASPTVEEARELFEARRQIELPIIEKVCRCATKKDLARLRAHVAQENEARKRDDGFLETREYNGNLYGTPRDFVERTLAEGYDLIMKPEVNGALAIKAAYSEAALIFLLPDKFSNLRERLVARRTETTEEIARRLEIAHREVQYIREFDYIIINEQSRSEEAVRDLGAILHAEKFRIHRYPDDTLQKVEHS